MAETVKSINDIASIKTPTGKARTWLRMTLLSKQLSDVFHSMIERKEIINQFYDSNAFMRCDDCVTPAAGLLIGLNIIDFKGFDIREANMDDYPFVIDLMYIIKIREADQRDDKKDDEDRERVMEEVLDQKIYLEEMNRHLNTTISNLRKRLESTEKFVEVDSTNHCSVSKNHDDVVINHSLLGNSGATSPVPIPTCTSSSPTTGAQSRVISLSKELESMTRMKNESEEALKLLETDVHEKQDTIISLRRQIEDTKAINIQLFNKIQLIEEDLKVKDDKILKIDGKLTAATRLNNQLKSKLKSCEDIRISSEEETFRTKSLLSQKDERIKNLELEVKKEKEWKTSLQQIVDEQQETITKIMSELDDARANSSEYHKLKKEYTLLQSKCSEYELSLEEIGFKLRE